MVIYSDTLIHLEFDPKTDILKVNWPHLVNESILLVRPVISKILESIKYFNVSKLLIDTKDTKTNIREEDFRKLSKEVVAALASSNLKKLARIIYAEPQREIRARILIEEISARLGATFESREFTDEKSALAWLESDEN
jgi:hypothetical protein